VPPPCSKPKHQPLMALWQSFPVFTLNQNLTCLPYPLTCSIMPLNNPTLSFGSHPDQMANMGLQSLATSARLGSWHRHSKSANCHHYLFLKLLWRWEGEGEACMLRVYIYLEANTIDLCINYKMW
jgi:hypothetical protein